MPVGNGAGLRGQQVRVTVVLLRGTIADVNSQSHLLLQLARCAASSLKSRAVPGRHEITVGDELMPEGCPANGVSARDDKRPGYLPKLIRLFVIDIPPCSYPNLVFSCST